MNRRLHLAAALAAVLASACADVSSTPTTATPPAVRSIEPADTGQAITPAADTTGRAGPLIGGGG